MSSPSRVELPDIPPSRGQRTGHHLYAKRLLTVDFTHVALLEHSLTIDWYLTPISAHSTCIIQAPSLCIWYNLYKTLCNLGPASCAGI